jgi:hypothetical protein
MKSSISLLLVSAVFGLLVLSSLSAKAGENEVKLAEGKVQMTAPSSWEKKKPQTRIVDYEFTAKAVADDKVNGRVTVMGAGGSVEANIDRWIAQFSQPDGESTRDRAMIEKFKVAGQDVHLVDINGRYKDQRGPFAPAVYRDDYRMMGAIIVTDGLGQYFVKMYGPKKTIAANEKAFKEMIDSLKVEKR